MALATSPLALALQAQRVNRRRRRRLRRPPAWLHPRQIERAFAAQLGAMALDFIRQVREVILPALPAIESQARSEQGRADSTRADAWFDRIAPLLEALRISATGRDRTVNAGAINIGQKTSKWNDKEWQKILRKTVGVGLLTAEPGLRDQLRLFAQTNANLITKLQADKIAEIQGVIERGFAQGLRHTEVAKQVMEKVKTTKTRARLIARDQVSKLNGRLTQMRQEEAGISKYIWQTAEDSRVRPTHEPMDGRLGRWDDSSRYASVEKPTVWHPKSGISAVELHPGQDILCRCFAEPFIQELADEPAEPAPKKKRKSQSDPALASERKEFKAPIAEATKKARGPRIKEFAEPGAKAAADRSAARKASSEGQSKEWKKWNKSLSDDELLQLDKWQTGRQQQFRVMDKYKTNEDRLAATFKHDARFGRQRKPNTDTPARKLQDWRVMNDALDRAPTNRGTVYRGIDGLDDKTLKRYLTSDTITFDARASTTLDRDVANEFALFKGKGSGGRVIFEYQNASGVRIPSQKSAFSYQREVIIPKGQKYRVRARRVERIDQANIDFRAGRPADVGKADVNVIVLEEV